MRATCTMVLRIVISVISSKQYQLWSPSQTVPTVKPLTNSTNCEAPHKQYQLWSPSQTVPTVKPLTNSTNYEAPHSVRSQSCSDWIIDKSVFEPRKVQILSSTVSTQSLSPNHVLVQCVRVTTPARTKRPECGADNSGIFAGQKLRMCGATPHSPPSRRGAKLQQGHPYFYVTTQLDISTHRSAANVPRHLASAALCKARCLQ